MDEKKSFRVQSGFGTQSDLAAVLSSKEVSDVMALIFECEIRVKFDSGNVMDTSTKPGSTVEDNINVLRRDSTMSPVAK
jgi:hypothetical protein